jgi:hypothetical protein
MTFTGKTEIYKKSIKKSPLSQWGFLCATVGIKFPGTYLSQNRLLVYNPWNKSLFGGK